jgi:hypothetical protein
MNVTMFFFSSVCRIPFRIFCSGGLVLMYCFSFHIEWKIFIPLSILNHSFAGYSVLKLKLFSFRLKIPHSTPFWLLRFCWEICCYFDEFTMKLFQDLGKEDKEEQWIQVWYIWYMLRNSVNVIMYPHPKQQ